MGITKLESSMTPLSWIPPEAARELGRTALAELSAGYHAGEVGA